MEQKMDDRMEKALKQDAAGLSSLSSKVPGSLRSLIASTPAAASVGAGAGAVAGSTAIGTSITTKLALWTVGGMLAIGAGYFALKGDDTPIKPDVPETQPSPSAIIEIDTPKPQLEPGRQAQPLKPAQKLNHPIPAPPKGFTQAQIDSMLHAQPEPENSVVTDSTIRASVRRK